MPDYQSQIVRLTRDVAGLDKDAAATAKKESELIGKINRAQDAVNRTNSASMVRSRLREIEQGSKSLAAIKEKQSDISRRRAQKYNNLIDYRNRQAREDEKARKRAADDERRLMRDREMHQRRMSSDLRRQSLVPMESFATESTKTYDFFICHASEDKDDFVRELAKLLRAGDAEVWYDEFTLKVGSRLRRETALEQEEAVAVMQEKYEVCLGLFHGFDWSKWTAGNAQERLSLLPAAQEHVLAQEDGKERCMNAVRELSQAFALAVPHEETTRIRDDVGFFQAVRVALSKRAATEARPEEELDLAVRQIISRAVASEGVMDIFAAAGLEKPDISVLSDDFLAEVRGMPHRNLAVELLQKLLRGEVSTRRRKNVVQARSFSEMLELTLRRYQNRAIEAAQVIEELIGLAKEMREANARGERLGLSDEELAFYDALETNDSAVQVLGDETLRDIARELVETVRGNVRIDWTVREDVRANLRRLVRRILRKHGYPPDKQEKATVTVLEQAEALSWGWAVG